MKMLCFKEDAFKKNWSCVYDAKVLAWVKEDMKWNDIVEILVGTRVSVMYWYSN